MVSFHMDNGERRRSTGINFWIFIVLIYINDLPNALQCNSNLFAEDTSLFSTMQDITAYTVSLSHALKKSF